MNRLRVGLALCGFVLAPLGVVLEEPTLVWAAIAALAASAIIRLLLRKGSDPKSDIDPTV